MILLTPPGAMVTRDILSREIRRTLPRVTSPPGFLLRDYLASCERRFIRRALRHTRGNVTRAAALMGLSRVSLTKKMKKYGLRRSARGRGSVR